MDGPPEEKFRVRKHFLIYPAFQLRLIWLLLASTVVTYGMLLFFLFECFQRLREQGILAHLPPDHSYFDSIIFQEDFMYRHMCAVLFGGFLVSTIVTLIVSQRLAGPIIRIQNYLKQIIKTGHVDPTVEFRSGDFFPDLPRLLNSALVRVQNYHREKGKD